MNSVKLTSREVEILNLKATGKNSAQVAESLYISKRTVDFHLANIFDKLQAKNLISALGTAKSLGLI